MQTTEYVFTLDDLRYTQTVRGSDGEEIVTHGSISDVNLVAAHIKLLVQASLQAGRRQ